jgi:hypothetical protein
MLTIDRRPQIINEKLEVGPRSRQSALIATTFDHVYLYGGKYVSNNRYQKEFVHAGQAWRFNRLTGGWKLLEVLAFMIFILKFQLLII